MGKKQWGMSCTQYVATALLETGILKATIDSSQPINTHPKLDLAESFLAECGRVIKGGPHFVVSESFKKILGLNEQLFSTRHGFSPPIKGDCCFFGSQKKGKSSFGA